MVFVKSNAFLQLSVELGFERHSANICTVSGWDESCENAADHLSSCCPIALRRERIWTVILDKDFISNVLDVFNIFSPSSKDVMYVTNLSG